MAMNPLRITLCTVAVYVLTFTGNPTCAHAVGDSQLSRGETVYVPVYSNIFTAPKEVPIQLANILSIRNTDMHNALQVTSVDYYDTRGALLKRFYPKAVTLAPLETTHVYLSQQDQAGGFGANFIVRWQAVRDVNAPIIECLMVGQGRVFVSPGQVIKEDTKSSGIADQPERKNN